ncbi:MAG: hypothetical protein KDD25_00700 [Bdellovibrionales bacterium]|nr:hypothetical protein [Bdellovibrionales bacterium]
MKKQLLSIVMSASMLALAACGGGGGGNYSQGGGTYYTHSQLANYFVNAVNSYLGAYTLEIVKTNTEQYDYIVVYDYEYGTYDAYYLGNYNPGENIYNYLYNYDSYFYYDLDYIGDGFYQDWYTGTIFEKTEDSSKDLLLKAALLEGLQVKKMAKGLQENFGLSEERSVKWAEAAFRVQNEGLSDEQLDNISLDLVGSTISDIKAAAVAGDIESLDEKIAKAGELNDNLLPSQINKILTDVFAAK